LKVVAIGRNKVPHKVTLIAHDPQSVSVLIC
jgi:hypothetical protein